MTWHSISVKLAGSELITWVCNMMYIFCSTGKIIIDLQGQLLDNETIE